MLRRNCNTLVLLVVGITLLGCLNVNARTELLEAQTELLQYQLDQAIRANAVFPLVPTETTQRNVQQLLVQRYVKQHQPTTKPKTSMKIFQNRISLNLDDAAEVNVKAFIAPIEHTVNGFHVEWDALANLRVAEPEKYHSTSVFQSFLPTQPVSVSECWQIDGDGVTELLRQLQPNPNLDIRSAGDSSGLWACLRAYNNQFADIMFRIHAEFKLEYGRFTPSQFTGHLVIDRIEKKIAFFEMYVPDGPVNFDVSWKKEKNKSYSIVDSGLCSQMGLRAGIQNPVQDAEFTGDSITHEKAERLLIQRFYKSEQINWVPPEQALEIAQTQQKPIHVISVDGPLADEAC